MNRVIQFFSYEQCYQHYTKRIINIRQAKIQGETIVAKPVLLLTLIDGVEEGIFMDNRITLNDWLIERYGILMRKYTRDSIFDGFASINNPFWHLETDGFWHLCFQGERFKKEQTPSTKWLKENVAFASFDEALWILLQNKVWRMKLRDYIIEHKLTDDFWNNKVAAEGLGLLTAILLAA